jgi:hypothetical protein
MEHTYYIIESPTLGTLRDVEYDGYTTKPTARYSVNGSRTDPEYAILFHTLKQATDVLTKLREHKARGYKTLKVTRTSDFRSLCEECQGWIDYSYGNPKGHDEQTCSVWRKWLAAR